MTEKNGDRGTELVGGGCRDHREENEHYLARRYKRDFVGRCGYRHAGTGRFQAMVAAWACSFLAHCLRFWSRFFFRRSSSGSVGTADLFPQLTFCDDLPIWAPSAALSKS
jgi:hypothetical protein